MFHLDNIVVMEKGDWEYFEQLEKRVTELENNVNNLVAWALSMQNQSESVRVEPITENEDAVEDAAE